jgi:hypothetical protein
MADSSKGKIARAKPIFRPKNRTGSFIKTPVSKRRSITAPLFCTCVVGDPNRQDKCMHILKNGMNFLVPDLVPLGSDEEDDDEAAWVEVEEAPQPVQCLFCVKSFPSILDAVSHAADVHNFDLKILAKAYNMDTYSYIKLINFIRTHNMGAAELMVCKEPLWDLEMYLKPVMENDPWLMYGKSGP